MLFALLLSLAFAQSPTATLMLAGMFSTNKATLTADGEATVRAWVPLIQASPEQTFEIRVHTDSAGSSAYNLTMTQRRAEAIRAALIAAGIPPEQLVAKGYGEEHPVAPNDSSEGRAQNRRAELHPAGEGAAAPVAAEPLPSAEPAPQADACAVLGDIVAQAPAGMAALRGATIDGNFTATDPIPGLSGAGKIHRRGEFWQELYEGGSAAEAGAAWAAAQRVLERCLTSGWTASEPDWVQRVPRYDPSSSGWEERELVMAHSTSGVRVRLQQERWPDSHSARLIVYQPAE